MNTDRINRIIAMEQNLDAAKQAVSDFEKSLEKFISAQPAIKELSDKLWKKQKQKTTNGLNRDIKY